MLARPSRFTVLHISDTLPAYKTAVERGFGFECDIYLSKDGRVFTFHDRNLSRTTDGAKKQLDEYRESAK